MRARQDLSPLKPQRFRASVCSHVASIEKLSCPSLPSRRRRSLPPLQTAIIVELALIVAGFYVWLVGVKAHWRMQDFVAVRGAAADLLHGQLPYPPPDPAVLAHATQLVYPPLVAYLFTPFAVLPYSVAGPAYFVLLLGALALTLRLLGVGDWRCFAAVVLWYQVAGCLGTGAIGPLLAVLLAIAWRWRDRAVIVAVAIAVACVAKLFLWPVVVWLIATRRWRATGLTVVVGAALLLAPFASLGAGVLHEYPKLLRALDSTFGPRSFSAFTLIQNLGASTMVTRLAVVCLGAALALALFSLARRHRDADAFTIAIAAALILSPIVWMHYYVLLIVPIAIARPKLSGLWFVPLLYWLSPQLESEGDLRRLLLGIGVTAAIVGTTILTRPSAEPEPAFSALRRRGSASAQ
jgi:Glycosyltransferase family 87